MKSSIIIFIYVLLAIFLTISDWLEKNNVFRLPSGTKHIVLLILVLIAFLIGGKGFKIHRKYFLLIVTICIYLVTNIIFLNKLNLNYFLGILFTFLFVIVFLISSNIETTEGVVIKIFDRLILFIFILSIIPITEGLILGTSLRWIPGAFREVGALGASMNIGTILSLGLFIITRKKKYLYFAIFFSFGVFLTTLKKSIITNLVCWLLYTYKFSNSKNRRNALILLFISTLALLPIIGNELIGNVGENIDYFNAVGSSDHVRIGMYLASFRIAMDFFPFGSGMGTFASLPSIFDGYSDLYYKYDVANIGSNSPSDVALGAHTLFDTFWPHIIAELGFIGTLIYLIIWFFPLRFAWKSLRKFKTDFKIGISYYIILVIFMMFNEGFTLYTPEIPSFILFHSGISGLCYYHLSKSK